MNPTPLLLIAAEGGSSPFAGAIYQSIAAIIVFLLLLFILTKFAWGPILKGLQDREGKIKADLEAAERAAAEAKATLAQYQAQLAHGREQAAAIIQSATAEAQKAANGITAASERELAAMKARAEAEIRYAKEQAINDIYLQAANLGADIAGKILKREINPTDHQQLVEESLTALKTQQLN